MVASWGVIVRKEEHVKLVDELLSEPLLQEYYLFALHNMIIDLAGLGAWEEFDKGADTIQQLIDEMQEGPAKSHQEANLRGRILYRQILAGDFTEAEQTADSLASNLQEYRYQPQMHIQHQFLIGTTYFYVGRMGDALSWIAELMADENLPAHRDFHLFTHIVNLILHLEMGHRTHLEYARDRTYRVLSKADTLYEVERAFLRFLRRYQRLPDKSEEMLQAYRELHAEILPLKEEAYERFAFRYFHFLPWLESKIEGRAMQVKDEL